MDAASMLERAKAVMRQSNRMLIERARANSPRVKIPEDAEHWEPSRLHALLQEEIADSASADRTAQSVPRVPAAEQSDRQPDQGGLSPTQLELFAQPEAQRCVIFIQSIVRRQRAMAEIAHFALETYKAEASHQDADPAHGADLDLQQVRFKENQAHPVNIAGRGSVRLLLEMARQDPDTVLTARDPVGATAALWAGLIEQKAVLKGVIDRFPDVVVPQQYTAGPYEGENLLHICIVHKDTVLIERLLADTSMIDVQLNARATGTFFLPHVAEPADTTKLIAAPRISKYLRYLFSSDSAVDEQQLAFLNHMKRLGDRQTACKCYYGEFPLSFAVCTNQGNLVVRLLHAAADTVPDRDPLKQCQKQLDLLQNKDTFGNSVLHLCAIYTLPEMFDYVCEIWENLVEEEQKLLKAASKSGQMPQHSGLPGQKEKQRSDLEYSTNNIGDTPLSTASRFGNRTMFDHLLSRSGKVFWKYGSHTCKMYPVRHLEFRTRGGSEIKGALQLIVDEGHLNLLKNHIVKQFVNLRWKQFAWPIFLRNLLEFAALLALLMLNVLCPPYSEEAEIQFAKWRGLNFLFSDLLEMPSFGTVCRLLVEIPFFVKAGVKFKDEFDELSEAGYSYLVGQSGAFFLENFCGFTWSSTALLILVIRVLVGLNSEIEDVLLVLTVMSSWGYSLFFCLGFERTGPFVVMIFQMVVKDIATFFIIEVVFLFAFAQCFVILEGKHGGASVIQQVQYFFAVMIGDVSFDAYVGEGYAKTSIFHVYVILVSVCLLNMLIAMMGDTYDTYKEIAEVVWERQRIMITMSIEKNEDWTEDKFYDEAELDGMVKHDYHTMFAGIPHIQIVEATNRCEDEGDGEDRDEDTTFADFVLDDTRPWKVIQAERRAQRRKVVRKNWRNVAGAASQKTLKLVQKWQSEAEAESKDVQCEEVEQTDSSPTNPETPTAQDVALDNEAARQHRASIAEKAEAQHVQLVEAVKRIANEQATLKDEVRSVQRTLLQELRSLKTQPALPIAPPFEQQPSQEAQMPLRSPPQSPRDREVPVARIAAPSSRIDSPHQARAYLGRRFERDKSAKLRGGGSGDSRADDSVHPISARLNKAITSRAPSAGVDAQRGSSAIESGLDVVAEIVADTAGYQNPSVYNKY